MVKTPPTPPLLSRATPLGAAWYELYLAWRVIRSDLQASIPVAAATAISAWSLTGTGPQQLLLCLIVAVANGTLFLYFPCLINQTIGVDEDRVNKPHRPIPSGLCTVDQAQRRIPYAVLTYLAFAWITGIIMWALAWFVVVIFYCYWGGDRHWCTRTLNVTLGSLALTAPVWAVTTGGIGALGRSWLAALFTYWILVGILQDLRDTAGDALLGRRTLPMILGDSTSRWVSAAMLAVFQPATFTVPLAYWADPNARVIAACTVFTAACWWLAWRVLKLRDKTADDLTYKVYAALTIPLMLGPLLV